VTWNAYAVVAHTQRAIWRVPLAVNIWVRLSARSVCIYHLVSNDNGRPIG
jgi:hypothetical protein